MGNPTMKTDLTDNNSRGSELGIHKRRATPATGRDFGSQTLALINSHGDEPWPVSLGCKWHFECLGAAT
jgi:hypothetical protein